MSATPSSTNRVEDHSPAAIAADPEFQVPALRQLVRRLTQHAPADGFFGPEDGRLPGLTRSDITLVCRLRPQGVVDEMDYLPLVEQVGRGAISIPDLAERALRILEGACLRAIWLDIQYVCDRRREADGEIP